MFAAESLNLAVVSLLQVKPKVLVIGEGFQGDALDTFNQILQSDSEM